MNFTLLGKLIWAIQTQIQAAKEVGRKYDFVEIKRSVLRAYTNQIGPNRDLYNKEVCSHFGKIGAKAAAKRRKEAKRLIAVLKEVLHIKKIQEAEQAWLQERIREGSVGISEDGDLMLLEEIDD